MAIPDSDSKNVQQGEAIHNKNGNGPVKNFPVAVGNMVQDLVDQGITEVPPRFIRPLQERTNSLSNPVQMLSTKVQIPEIDMAVLLQEDLCDHSKSKRISTLMTCNFYIVVSLMELEMTIFVICNC